MRGAGRRPLYSGAIRLLIAVALCVGVALPLVAQRYDRPYYANDNGVALERYDVVAYHLENEAIQGRARFRERWGGVTWYFANAENAALFAEDPERYLPQYGGYCAYAVAHNSLAPVDPEAFAVIDEKLYLNFSRSVQRRWNRRRVQYIERGDLNWPELSAEFNDNQEPEPELDPDLEPEQE